MSDELLAASAGTFDECRPAREVGFFEGHPILVPGDRVIVRGWVRAPGPIVAEIAPNRGKPVVVTRAVHRPDVPGSSPSRPCGFETAVDLGPRRSGELTVVLLAGRIGKKQRRFDPARRLFVAWRLDPQDRSLPETLTPYGRFRSIADCDPRHHRHGWGGRRTIRPDVAIAVRGWILDHERRPPARVQLWIEGNGECYRTGASEVADGDATFVAGGKEWSRAGFYSVIAPFPLRPGLHFITATLTTVDGKSERGPTEAFQVVPEDDWEPPLFLTTSQPEVPCETEATPSTAVIGTPVVVRGTSIDASSGEPMNAYVRWDDERPLPVPQVPGNAGRFAGIADTGVLLPGAHRLQILLEPKYPGYWSLAGEYTIEVRAKG